MDDVWVRIEADRAQLADLVISLRVVDPGAFGWDEVEAFDGTRAVIVAPGSPAESEAHRHINEVSR